MPVAPFEVLDADTMRPLRRAGYKTGAAAFRAGDRYADRNSGMDYKVFDADGNLVPRSVIFGSALSCDAPSKGGYRVAHLPHGNCPGRAAEYPSELTYRRINRRGRIQWVTTRAVGV